jgi:hypothetical protein
MTKLKQTFLAALVFAGLADIRRANASVFVNVTPTVTGGAEISGTQVVPDPFPATTFKVVPVPLQTATLTGVNQNASAGTNASIFAAALNTFNTSVNAMTITSQSGEGYSQLYTPDTTVGSNVSIGISFQVATPGTFQLSGYGFSQMATSYELHTLYSNGTFSAMQGSNTVLSAQNYEGFEWNISGGPQVNSSVLDLNLTPGTVYTLAVQCSDTYATVNGLTYLAAYSDPRSISANLTITDLTSSVPEPTSASLLALGSVALLGRRRSRRTRPV